MNSFTRNKFVMCLVLIIIIILIALINHFHSKSERLEYTQPMSSDIEIKFDEKTELYYLTNTKTGEIIAAGESEESLRFYVENPDFNVSPFIDSKIENLEEYKELLISEGDF